MAKKTIKFTCGAAGPGGWRSGEIRSEDVKMANRYIAKGFAVEIKKQRRSTTREKKVVKPKEES